MYIHVIEMSGIKIAKSKIKDIYKFQLDVRKFKKSKFWTPKYVFI